MDFRSIMRELFFYCNKNMIICIRHGDDDYSNATHRHDHRLTTIGEKQIRKRVKELLKKFGTPKIVYCSPFKRTKQSLKILLEEIVGTKPKVIFEKGLSKYFGKTHAEDASIFPETKSYHKDLPFYENKEDFHKRVDDFCHKLAEKEYDKKGNVWCITHAIIYKRMSNFFGKDVGKNIPFAAAVKIGYEDQLKKENLDFFTKKRDEGFEKYKIQVGKSRVIEDKNEKDSKNKYSKDKNKKDRVGKDEVGKNKIGKNKVEKDKNYKKKVKKITPMQGTVLAMMKNKY